MAKLKDDPAVQELIAKAVAAENARMAKEAKSASRDLVKRVAETFANFIKDAKDGGNRGGATLLSNAKADVVAAIKAPF